MFALTQSAAVTPARVVAKAPAAKKSAKAAFVVRASKEESALKRAAIVGVAAAAVMHAAAADAITIPSQASTGGLGRESGKGQASSNATMEGYTLEGTSKGGHSPKVKFGVMADARAAAEAAAMQSVSAPAKK
jgi:hypothetical protein